MKTKRTEHGYVLALERGEELIASLTDLCEREGVRAAHFTAIGAVENVRIGYYDLPKREYYFRHEPGVFEVASMTGNAALVDSKPFIHAHAVLSRCDGSCATVGGHVKEAYVAVTLEVFMTVMAAPLERKLNDDIGLRLLDL